jgi:hypothetical protein
MDKRHPDAAASKRLCLRLLLVDSQTAVIDALTEAGYWDDVSAWRLFGDNENNYSTIGNQQSRAEAALVEKIVNSIDARLVNACLEQGIDPESPAAPQSIREAVALLFEKRQAGALGADAGRVKNWSTGDRTREARLITLSATGYKPEQGDPCITIADAGEGQTPDQFANTFLSLHRTNKLRIPFVQGKFNMGGTGALQFAGQHNLQLILSRRNPALQPSNTSERDRHWGFTIVRRESPSGATPGSAATRSSTYTYLAPDEGRVLSFAADEMPILPEGQNAYGCARSWGTLIKLYEYEMRGFRSNIVSAGQGLLRRIDLLLPEVALPIRLYECRPYKGHIGSFETNVTGVGVRLDDDGQVNLEDGFPASAVIAALGESMRVTIYAFKRGKAEEYRLQQGVIFAINGQSHGHLSVDFFRRKSVGMSYLADSLFLIVDCSEIGARSREDLFMNSRDRLRDNDLRKDIEDQLEAVIKDHQGLRALANKRRQEDIASKLDDSKPLADMLEKLIKDSPALASLFNMGARIPNPFAPQGAGTTTEPFRAKRFPTYFRFKDRKYGQTLEREAFLNRRPRIVFETDAENSYFSRDEDPGQVDVAIKLDGVWTTITSFSLNLSNGTGNLNCPLPHNANVGDDLAYRVRVTDGSRVEAFENYFVLRVRAAGSPPVKGAKPGTPQKPPSKEKGKDRERPALLSMPPITPVREAEWPRYEFTKTTALRVKDAGTSESEIGDPSTTTYDFYVNVDNQFLKAEQKRSRTAPQVLEARFMYALVLVGLALIQGGRTKSAVSSDEEVDEFDERREPEIEKQIDKVTSALAPILLPMMDLLPELPDAEEGT